MFDDVRKMTKVVNYIRIVISEFIFLFWIKSLYLLLKQTTGN